MSNVRNLTENAGSTGEVNLSQEADRWAGVVESLDSPLVLTNPERKIIFVNEKARDEISVFEDDLGVSADDIIGSPVEILFGKSAKELRSRLKDARQLPIKAEITIGEDSREMTISAVKSAAGDFLGLTVTWPIEKNKRWLHQLQVMVEKAPVSIMLAEPISPSSTSTKRAKKSSTKSKTFFLARSTKSLAERSPNSTPTQPNSRRSSPTPRTFRTPPTSPSVAT